MAEERICLIPFDIDMIIGAQGSMSIAIIGLKLKLNFYKVKAEKLEEAG